MANAMLEEEFRSSHEDLMKIHNNALAPPPRLSNQFKPDSPRKVEFVDLPPPMKRSRVGSSVWSTKGVLQGITDSVTPDERKSALQKALETFDHTVQTVHDEELREGADVALLKLIVLMVHVEANDEEVCLALQTLEATFRASSPVVGKSFERLGGALLSILVKILDNDLRRRDPQNAANLKKNLEATTSNDETMMDLDDAKTWPSMEPVKSTLEQDTILQKTMTIIGHLARVGQATKTIAHHPGLLGSLVHVAGEHNVPWEARLTSLWILANLACHDENMPMMVCTPNLLECLVSVSNRPIAPDDSLERIMDILRSQSLSSRAILNLSWSASNKIILAEHNALVDMLCMLAVHRTSHLRNSRTVQECMLSTRRHAVGALRNLAAASTRAKTGLTNYRNGCLLDTLTDAALNDSDDEVKDRAFAAIHNLTTQATAERIVNHPALVLALKGALMGDQGLVAKKHASSTLMVLERSIDPTSSLYSTLRDLQDALQSSPSITTTSTHNDDNAQTKGNHVHIKGMAEV